MQDWQDVADKATERILRDEKYAEIQKVESDVAINDDVDDKFIKA